jgi:glucose/arabinose dehydrogenase
MSGRLPTSSAARSHLARHTPQHLSRRLSRRLVFLIVALAVAALALAACGEEEEAWPPEAEPGDPAIVEEALATPEPEATPDRTPDPADAEAATDRPEGPEIPLPVAFENAFEHMTFERPIEAGWWPRGGADALYVVEQKGIIYLLTEERAEVIFDFEAHVPEPVGEEGLLSIALDPNFDENGYVWMKYSPAVDPHRSIISRFQAPPGEVTIDPDSELQILEVSQPYFNHNGGALRFGPDGMLYFGFGDGGSGGDPHGHGQDTSTLLGSIIRIDVSEASEEEPYRIPEDNPFLDDPDVRDEIWAYGVRNPWRMDFDPLTGALWVADVGQVDVEEVSIATAGANLGWAIMEGDICYPPGTECDTEGLTMPLVTYENTGWGNRCSITGGVVYRGTAVPELTNAYIFSDWCSGELWAVNADEPGDVVIVTEGLGQVVSFAIGPDQSIYVLAFGRPLQRLVSPE